MLYEEEIVNFEYNMEIVIATHNKDKYKELFLGLKSLEFKLHSLNDFPEIGEIIEDGDTLEENALIKAQQPFVDNINHIEKWNPKKPLTAIYFDIDKQRYFIKRFVIENSDKEDSFIKENGELVYFVSEWRPVIKIIFEKPRGKDHLKPLEVNAEEFISVKGFKAFGNQITSNKIKRVELKEVLDYKEEEVENPLEICLLYTSDAADE